MSESKTYYDLEEYLEGNEVKIFTIKGASKENWHMRARIPTQEGTQYFRKSLRTTDRNQARFLAVKLYREMLARASTGMSLKRITIDEAYEQTRHRRITDGFSVEKYDSTYRRYIGPYFSKILRSKGIRFLDQITQSHIDQYLHPVDGWRANFW